MTEPLRLVFGAHIHQPVGNFDHVFEQHVREAYRPLLERLTSRGFAPFVLHVSGPLLEWLEAHDRSFLDLVGRLVADRKLELLISGYDEPILAALPREDRVEQIGWMREALERLFGRGAESGGLWLTERVWEPDLAADLVAAGVRYALVDDRHFLVTGFPRARLHAPFWTDGGGAPLALFPIDERLRYLVPFKPPAQILGYLEQLRGAGHRLAVLADDGEKFGGWPGTASWVYERGWIDEFLEVMLSAVGRGDLKLVTCAQALAEVPSGGLAYLPSASYREMERWALPADAAVRLEHLEKELGEHRIAGPDGGLVRGTLWRNFLVRYPEANRIHKKMLALSALRRSLEPGRGGRKEDLALARRAIGRAQCNDAYWHGVFGGLYLPHLRAALWRNLAEAERALRRDQRLTVQLLDFDHDGHEEIWIHSGRGSVVIAPARGGAVEEYTLFQALTNYADVLTRRPEAYHEPRDPHGHGGGGQESGSPAYDADDRALFVDRILPADLAADAYAAGRYTPAVSWARTAMRLRIEAATASEVVVVLEAPEGSPPLEKRIRVGADGSLAVAWRWDPASAPAGAWFAPELSLAAPLDLALDPAADAWRFPVETTAKSERGLERTLQGESVTPRWPLAAGAARLELGVRTL
ncbi:MAG TPA: alpha-amylase/4-alpha-glucanotransferase domain-containing protein [Gemmatimonadales bacterium]|nr:alpha-amylase/4-alpha-glucanotransferase domain-containing protein [Gemmatimonadales bacterium]